MNQFVLAVIGIACFIPAIVVHEVAHGFVAYKMGDSTAKDAHRLSFNPLRHIDPFGTVLLPLLLVVMGGPAFGYAKPVPYDPRHFKNLKMGEILVGLAGPAANLAMALLVAVIFFGARQFSYLSPLVMSYVLFILYYFGLINLCLMFFNLLPIPPLDGSSIIVPLLPKTALPAWYKIQRYAFPILLVLVIGLPYLGSWLGFNFNPLSDYIQLTAGNLANLLYPLYLPSWS
ncbi:MAG: site-2 protease family protein [Actinomycetia bacterium]|nr:site-2 protease family protein [Actinomycetes bacterium]